MQNKLASLIIVFTYLLSFSVSGQKLINSPYSRFNIGSLEPAGSFRSIGMGGVGTAVRDNSSVYFLNPASYSSIDTISFIFDFGLDYGINYLTEGSNHHFSDDMNFDHLLLGFPVIKGLGIAAGLVPFSNGYYKITESVLKGDPGYDAITGEYISAHTGEGGFTKLFLGSGVNITKYFSAGINMNVIFGNIRRLNEIDFTDYYGMFHNNTTEKLQLTGINLEYGAQAIAPFKNGFYINAGMSFSTGKHYNSRYEKVGFLFTAYSSVDTLFNFADSTRAYLPGDMRMGISFGKKNKFTAGFDYSESKWSKAVISSTGGYFSNTRSYRFGAEYIPDKFSNYSYLKQIEYRIGGHIEDSYLVINGEQVKEYGVSCGFGLPLRRTYSKVNFFFDYSKKYGSGISGLHTENIFTVGASLNLYDHWFLKRKYD
ncbi:MAG: hypothetical protein NTW82_11065 [Bacteroidia bacterium]|nr:hypothetical protein [Bacteroidia bacterium]